MAYGLQIFRDDGSLWMSPDVTPMNFIKKIRFNAGSGELATGIPEGKSIAFFVRHDQEHGRGLFSQIKNGGQWNIKYKDARVAGYLYIFANWVNKTSGYGVAVYNAGAEMVWNTGMLPLQLTYIDNPYGVDQRGDITIGVGFNVAVLPGVCSTWLAPLEPAHHIFLVGSLLAGASGNNIYITRYDGTQVNGTTPAWRYRDKFLCINTDYYD
ncbi:TPA: hypothetical protein NBM92_002225 [Klebsiella oxytoca]|nr:hypothetical protein [Klebsiella oxytoca]